MTTNYDFNDLIIRITEATNSLESDVATINEGTADVTQAVTDAQTAATSADGSATAAAGSAASAITAKNDTLALKTQTQAIADNMLANVPVQEAPMDGKTYGRKDAGWAEVVGGGGGGGAATFVELIDVPTSYTGMTGKVLAVKATEDGLEFVEDSGAVESVNGQTGTVVLNASDVDALPDTYVPDWTDVTNKPTTFAPSGHTHSAADITDLPSTSSVEWYDVQNKPLTFAPRAHEHSASDFTSGTFLEARIPDLSASKTTYGTFAEARIPSLNATKVGYGTFAEARIPSLNASKIGSGVIATGRLGLGSAFPTNVLLGDGYWGSVPKQPASFITTGTFNTARLGTGTASASTVLLGDGTWGSVPAVGFPISETVTYNGTSMKNWPVANPNESINGELLSRGSYIGIVAMIESGSSSIMNSIPCGSYTFTTSLSTANTPDGGQAPSSGGGIIQVFNGAGAGAGVGVTKSFVATSFDEGDAPDLGVMSIRKTNYWTRVGF